MRKLSYVSGTSDKPLIGQTIGDYFDYIVGEYPDNMAIISRFQNVRYTYKELQMHVNQCAKSLLKLKLKKGDRVGIWSPNCVEWLIVQLATSKLGLILVNVNPSYRVYELKYALNHVEIKAIFISEKFRSSDYSGMLYELLPKLKNNQNIEFQYDELPHLRNVISLSEEPLDGIILWKDFLEMGNEIDLQDVLDVQNTLSFDEPINIQFTSGTTGYPKGATLTHHNILNNGNIVTDLQGFTSEDKLVIPVPLYHCFGMVMGNLGCISKGATMIYPSKGFDPDEVLKAIEEEKATALYGVPTMFFAELNHPQFKEFDLSSLRTGIMAGSLCPTHLMRRVQKEMHMKDIEICYGMTETSPVSTQTRLDAPFEKRVTTVGQVLPYTEIKIVNPDTKEILPLGETGELCTRGFGVMLGYWENDKKTRESIDDARWMHTGDLATIDEDGYINIVGRIKDMVIRGGENIYPKFIEEFLHTHPDIAEAQVIGVPDEKYGEQLCAWIQLENGKNLTEDDVKNYCRGKIASYKIPYYVMFVKEYPTTVTGKIKKIDMRKISIKKLGLEEK